MQATRRQSFWLSLALGSAVLAGVLMPVNAESQDEPQQQSRDRGPVRAERVDLVQASKIARAELGGEIIKAELTRYRGADVYMVRLLDRGRVREALVDASTGEMLLPGQIEEAE